MILALAGDGGGVGQGGRGGGGGLGLGGMLALKFRVPEGALEETAMQGCQEIRSRYALDLVRDSPSARET